MGKNRDDRNQHKGGFQKPNEKGIPGQQPTDRNLDKQKMPMGGGQGQQQKQPWKEKDK